jgi:hypothetical protein
MNSSVPMPRTLRCSSLLAAMSIMLCWWSTDVSAADPVAVTTPVPIPASTPVTITNAAAIAKAEGIQHPFQAGLDCTAQAGVLSCDSAALQLPATRRLAIEYVSAVCTLVSTAQLSSVGVKTGLGSETPVTHALNHVDHPAPLGGVGPQHVAIAAHTVKIYADAGSSVGFSATNVSGGEWKCAFSLSGQLIDVP